MIYWLTTPNQQTLWIETISFNSGQQIRLQQTCVINQVIYIVTSCFSRNDFLGGGFTFQLGGGLFFRWGNSFLSGGCSMGSSVLIEGFQKKW